MKKIYNLFTKLIPCLLMLTMVAQTAYSQCAAGENGVEVTYASGAFNGENSWVLWDVTADAEVLCGGQNPAVGTFTACYPAANTIELHTFESFGDGWNAAANIELIVFTEPNCPGGTPIEMALYDDDGEASGNGSYACGSGTPAGLVVASFPVGGGGGAACTVICPCDEVVGTDPGVCEAVVTIGNPTLEGPDCVILPTPGDFVVASSPTTPFNFDALGLIDTPFSIPGVIPVPASADCVTEVCIDFDVQGDFSFFTEVPFIADENGNVIGQVINPGGVGDCNPAGDIIITVCVPVATFNGWAADGVLDFTLLADPDVDNFCATSAITATVAVATNCVDFLNSYTGLANGPATYPIGTTCVNITGTGSGAGADFPIDCVVKVIVEDNEPPMMTCPGDFTYNLQGGQCEWIYDFEVLTSDNCEDQVVELVGSFGSLTNCPGSSFALACGFTPTAQVQEFDLTSLPPSFSITEACFIFDNAAWGINNATINIYEGPAGLTASGSPLPCYKTAVPVATSGVFDAAALGGVNGTELCVPLLTPLPVGATTQGLYMEVLTTGGALTWNGTVCNGIVSDGTNTFLCSDNCGDGYYASFGFTNRDAFYSFRGTVDVVPVAPPATPGFNEFASGDALPIGVHCFEFSAEDLAGNMSSCDWCITINEFPSDQVVTSLACNDLVNVSLNEDCEAFISADMFLEGGPYGCYFNGYEVYIEGVLNEADVNGMTLGDPDLTPGTYIVTVNDVIRGNSCWGEMVVEDKLPPVFEVEDLTVTCKQDIPEILSLGVEENGAIALPQMVGEAITSAEPFQTVEFFVEGGSCLVEDVDVAFDLNHTWVGDIELSVISPAGTEIFVQNNVCGNTDNMSVIYDDEGADFACGDLSPGTGARLKPLTPLAGFDGEEITGMWTVKWDDTAGGDEGMFNSASLTINNGDIVCGVTRTAEQYIDAFGSACALVDLEIIQEQSIGSDCDGGTVLRTWVATDAAGNTSSQVQTITRERIGIEELGTEWFWPASTVDLTCGAETSPDAIYAYFRAQFEEQFPCPLPTCDPNDGHNYDPDFVATWECNANAAGVRFAYPLCFNDKDLQERFDGQACNVFFTYDDQYLSVCGLDCDGNSKVIRTWTALDWCTGETANGVQIIHAKDNEGPTATPPAPMTVSANPWGCAANFRLPVPDHLSDNCSSEVTYRIYGQPGTVTEIVAGPRVMLDSDDNPVLDENGYPIWIVEGLPKGMAPYTYTYELSDCCGNVSYVELQVTVVDGSAPSAITKQNIVISLTSSPTDPSGGSAKLYVESVDNGSHDGDCGPVRIAVRRVDSESDPEDNVGFCGNLGDDHNNNSTFFNFNDLPNSAQPDGHDRDDTDEGRFVKFCCQDLIDGDGEDLDGDGINDYVLIDVELGVWDDANMDGIPGTPGDQFGIAWATVRVEAKLSPTLTCPPLVKITCDMDDKNLALTGGSAYASSTCGNLDVAYEDLCGLDINQDGVIATFTVTNENGMTINEVGMCTDVNRDGRIENYVAPWWSEVDEDLFNKACHYGPITRWWSIDGTEVKCRQLIIVERPASIQQFDGSVSIDWPYSEDEFIRLADNDGDDCGLMEVSGSDIEQIDTNDDDIPDYAEVRLSCIDGLCDEPVWVDATCSLVGYSLESDTFFFEGDACRKIINTWTVIDWCQYEVNNPASGGIWTWTVIGKLIDTYAPVVAATDSMFRAVPGSGGSGTTIDERACVGVGIQMSATATDTNVDSDGNIIETACPSEWLKWNVYVDINNDWVFEREWSSFVAEDRNTSTDPLWSEDNAADNLNVYGYLIPDVRVGNRGGVDNNEGDFATAPGFEYTINIPDAIPADCGETTHRVVWKVYDGCGNVTSTTSYFTVQDKKAPTPYCINLSTALMADPDGAGPEVAMVELWAIDFDAGSFDNCTEADDLCFTFTDVAPELDPYYNADLRSSAHIFNCDDLEVSSNSVIRIPVYVWDKCGNYDFCEVNLRLVDNNGGCFPDTTGTGSMIAGTFNTEFGELIENVEVSNMEMINEFETEYMAPNGQYIFNDNTNDLDYSVTASKDGDDLNGISTLDLVLIQRHILGLASLDSPYKLIAADVNNDGAVTVVDLIHLRKLILGVTSEFENNSSWRFTDASRTLDINNPWDFVESIDIYNLSANRMDENFIGIKIGDVNESVVASLTSSTTEVRSSAVLNIDFEDEQVEAGQTVSLTVTGDNFNNVFGYQFTLNAHGLELVNVIPGAVNVTEENFGIVGNAVTTSWNSDEALSVSGELFTMTFKSNTSGMLSEIINVSSDVTKAEAYVGSNLDIVNIALNNTKVVDADYALNQNEPNPFSENTVIGFVMPQSDNAKLTITDVTGKVVKTITGNYAAGFNQIELSKSDLGVAGLYYYRLDSGDFTATKKMIIIE